MEWLKYIYYQIASFVSGVGDVISYIWSTIQGVRYGLTTILSGVSDLISNIFNSGIF